MTKGSNIDYAAYQYYRDLKEEMKLHPDGMPYAWLLAKLNQLHLDVYTHNFSLNYPFRNKKANIYVKNNSLRRNVYLRLDS